MALLTEVITIDESSQRIHIRVRRNGLLYDHPRCNLDDAGRYREVSEAEVADAPREAFCQYDFPNLVEGRQGRD